MIDETRVQHLVACLQPVLAADLPPDAAGSKALALALLAVQAEGELGKAPGDDDMLLAQAHLLPAFIEGERDRGRTDDLATLVRRFVRGGRPATESPQPASATAQRRARLRELQREGVDLSLIQATLAQSPLQRIANMERQLRFVRQLQQARRAPGTDR
jgi:hypothetical protein